MSEVLVVDDERRTRDLVGAWLKAAAIPYSEAPDAETALSMMAGKPFAVVMIDKDMPGHGGLWLVEEIQKAHPAVAMLLATGDDQIPPRVSLSRGIQGYLVKPFKRELVIDAITAAISWHTVAQKQAAKTAGADPIDTWLQGRAGRPPKEGS